MRFATGEDGAAMRHGQRTNFAPNGTNFVGLTTIKTLALVEDATAHGIAQHVVVVACSHSVLFFQLFGSKLFGVFGIVPLQEVGNDFVESIVAFLLRQSLLGNIVHRLIQLVVHLLAQIFVVHLVVVFALNVFTQFLSQFFLHGAHGLDGIVSHFEGLDKVLFGNLVHFSFHHHDVIFGCAHHDIHVGFLHLLEGGINNILAVNPSNANLADVEIEGYI